MKTKLLFLALLCAATILPAQTVNDSLHLEITSVMPFKISPDAPQNYKITFFIENRTKEFRYLLPYRKLELYDDPRPYWRIRFEVEYKDGTREICGRTGGVPMKDYQKAVYLMPGERRTDHIQLIEQYTLYKSPAAIDHTTRPLSDIKRIRILNGRGVLREPNVEDLGKHFDKLCNYKECTIASDWYNVDFSK